MVKEAMESVYIVPNFREANFLLIGLFTNFMEIIFMDRGVVSHAYSDVAATRTITLVVCEETCCIVTLL